MKSRTSPLFRKLLSDLPAAAQRKAARAYRVWRINTQHPGLEYKSLQGKKQLYVSVRINLKYRAIGAIVDGDVVLWFWIGHHHEYDRLIERL